MENVVKIKNRSSAKPEDLIVAGWSNTNIDYAGWEIWEKGDERLLYDPEISQIHTVY